MKVTDKSRLDAVETELNEQRDALPAATAEVESARETYANDSEGPLTTDSDEFKAVKAAVAKEGEIRDRIDELEQIQETLLAAQAKRPKGQDRPAGNPTDPRGDGWDIDALFADDDVRSLLQEWAHASEGSKFGRKSLGEVISRDAFAADVTGTTAMRKGEFQGILPQLRRQLTVLDLIAKGTMDNNTFPYTVEGGSFTTGVAETDEGSAKAEGAVTFTDAEATARTIAVWLKLQKQSLEDVPALQAIISERLRYMVERRLETQILAGDGTAPNLRGILNTSGIGAVAYNGTQEPADTVLDAITTILLADARATGTVLHPTDWAAALKNKAAGDGHYFSGGPFSVTPQVMWGVPLVPSPAITAGIALVGDWDIGAMLLIRSGLQVLLSDSDQDDFTKNKVTILAELRAALPVFRPAAFCTADILA